MKRLNEKVLEVGDVVLTSTWAGSYGFSERMDTTAIFENTGPRPDVPRERHIARANYAIAIREDGMTRQLMGGMPITA